MNLLKFNKNFLNIHAKKMIYFAQIQSHLSYGLCIWGNMIPDGVLNKLQKLQNKCISLINGKIATPDNYKSLGILRVKELIALKNYKFGYRLLHKTLPSRIIDLANSDQKGESLLKQHNYETRYKNLLNKAKASNKLYKSCIIYQGNSCLGTLKVEALTKSSVQSFSSHCKKLLLGRYQ